MIYDDFPACLPRHAWLVVAAEKNLGVLFNDTVAPTCKACGEQVGRGEWGKHRRYHVRQLQQTARQRERENINRLRAVSRLRAETRQAVA